MELTITLTLSILANCISVASFVLNRKDKSNKDVGQDQYEKGKTDQLLTTILEKIDKIEKKLDKSEIETRNIVREEVEKHEMLFHHIGKKGN